MVVGRWSLVVGHQSLVIMVVGHQSLVIMVVDR